MKKKIVLSMLSFIMAMVLGACTMGGNTKHVLIEGNLYPDGTQEQTTLKMWIGGTQWQGDYLSMLEGFIKDFNNGKLGDEAKKLNITIKATQVNDITASLGTASHDLSTAANIVIWDRFNTPTAAYNDYLLPIDGYLTDDSNDNSKIYKGAFNQAALNELKGYSQDEEGNPTRYYGLPIDVDTWGIYVNMDTVNNHNKDLAVTDSSYVDLDRLNENWTWFDLMDIAKRLTTSEVNGYDDSAMYQHYYKFFTSTGKSFLKDDTTVPDIDTVEGKNVLKYFSDLHDAKVSSGSAQPTHFYNGKLAMYNSPTYFAGTIENSKNVSEYRFLPQPRYNDWKTNTDFLNDDGTVKGDNIGMMGGFALALPLVQDALRSDEYFETQKVAMQFINWWANGDGAKQWAIATKTLPAKISVQSDADVLAVSQVVADASGFASKYVARPSVRGFEQYTIASLDAHVQGYVSKSVRTESDLSSAIFNLIKDATTYLFK